MNERIRQLALQSGGQRDYEKYHKQPWNFSESEVEKFADMIVRECIGVVEDITPGYQDYRDQIEDAFRRDCIQEIKEHFGVVADDEVEYCPKCNAEWSGTSCGLNDCGLNDCGWNVVGEE